MAPPRRILRQQVEIMLDVLEENKEMGMGLQSGPPASQGGTRAKWASLGKQLNTVPSGTKKTPEEWKKYWFEWRHRCKKKVANIKKYKQASGGTHTPLQLSDLELRVLELSGKAYLEAGMASTIQLDNSSAKESDSELREDIKTESKPVRVRVKRFATASRSSPGEDQRTVTPPPSWALELEDRKIAAEERMADALESMASIMRAQDERREALEYRLADALTAIAGTVQDLNSGIQEAVKTLHQLRPPHLNGADKQEDVFS